MQERIVFRPMRLLWLLPIFYLQFQFEDQVVAIIFGVTLAWLTSKLFPLSEIVKSKKADDEQPGE